MAVLYQKWVEHFADQTGPPFLGAASYTSLLFTCCLYLFLILPLTAWGNFFFFFLLAGEGGKREKNVLAKMVGTTIFSMVWWIRLEVTIRGRRVTAGERSSPETIL